MNDEPIIDDPELVAMLEAFAADWRCTPEQAIARISEREAAERDARKVSPC